MTASSLALWSLPVGALLDAILGDPRGWPHPVRWIGRAIAIGERVLLPRFDRPISRKLAGLVLAVLIVAISSTVAWSIVAICDRIGGLVPLLGRSLLIYWGLAARSLGVESLLAAEAADLATARRELSMIVGRDVESLDWPAIRIACVETVGENTSDGIIAPLFWYALLGPLGMWGFKAINTLDSMIGHRDENYRDFGWASARLDDLAGLIPARWTWLLISISAVFLGERPRSALLIGWRDGRKHDSPNAAWGEAAMAGALGIQVGGEVNYEGIPKFRHRLGDPVEPIGPMAVRRSVRLMGVATAVGVLTVWGVRSIVLGLP